MPTCCLKRIGALAFACALLSAACNSPTGPTPSAASQPATLATSQSQPVTADTAESTQSPLAGEAGGQSPQDLAARGWDCRPTPIPNRVSCSPPNQMHPALLPGPPPPTDGPATFTLKIFDNGVFIGTNLLIRSDLYQGQPCNGTGAPYRFIGRIGYYECLHVVGG